MAKLSNVLVLIGFLTLWQLVTSLQLFPSFILPPPKAVVNSLSLHFSLLLLHGRVTLVEMLFGFVIGSGVGIVTAMLMFQSAVIKRLLLPLLIASQALPTFALAPLIIMWLGYGIISKIVITTIMIFFPITSNFYDGLCQTPQEYLQMAAVMQATPWRKLWYLRVPCALPALASGLKIAAIYAPIGAIVGEWVGASRGLGYMLVMANAQLQTALVFAILIMILVLTLGFYFIITRMINWCVFW